MTAVLRDDTCECGVSVVSSSLYASIQHCHSSNSSVTRCRYSSNDSLNLVKTTRDGRETGADGAGCGGEAELADEQAADSEP